MCEVLYVFLVSSNQSMVVLILCDLDYIISIIGSFPSLLRELKEYYGLTHVFCVDFQGVLLPSSEFKLQDHNYS